MYHRYLDKRLSFPRTLWLCLVLAIVLHVLVLRLQVRDLDTLSSLAQQGVTSKDNPIEITPLPPDANQPIVQTSRAKEQDEDEKTKARFGGEFKNRVKKETQSPLRGRFQQGMPLPAPGEGGDADELAKEGDEPGKAGKKRGPRLADLLPFGSSPNSLPNDVTEGNETVLNTDPVLYASFINRIADEVYDPWVTFARDAVKAIYLVGRKLESNTYVTKINVMMDTGGHVTAIKMLQSSGVNELDEATKKAFWEVEPFPNPPEKMFTKEGSINLVYEFHFEWKTSSFNIVPDLI